MISLLSTLLRHGFVVLAAYLAAHGFANANTTQGLACGLIITAVVCIVSWACKMMKFAPVIGISPSTEDALRTALGSVISQGITFASSYYAIDANDPSALGIAVINSLASHWGVHQQIAHSTPLDVATAIKAFIACLCLLPLSSCVTMKKLGASLSTPQAVQIEASLADVGLDIAKASGTLSTGDAVAFKEGIAIITSQGSSVSKIVPIASLVTDTAVAKHLLTPGTGAIIKDDTVIIVKVATPAAAAAAAPVAAPVAPSPAS